MLMMELPPGFQKCADAGVGPFAREHPGLGRPHAARAATDERGLSRESRHGQLPGGRYPAPWARRRASKPSSGDMSTAVFSSFTAPLPAMAMETAAALMLLGTSKITTTS